MKRDGNYNQSEVESPRSIEEIKSPTILKSINIEDSKEKEKDWNAKDAYYAGYLTTRETPDKIDLCDSFNNWKIHKQKEGSYSCVGYAVTDMVHWHLHQKVTL